MDYRYDVPSRSNISKNVVILFRQTLTITLVVRI